MKTAFILLALALVIAPAAAAVTITGRPDSVANGQPMYITIGGLPDGATFSLLVESVSAVQPGSEFLFQMSQFTMPFSLTHSSVTANLSGTMQNKLEVMKESTIVTVSGTSTGGHFSTTKTYDITAGTYDYFRLSGTSLPTASSISSQVQVTGTKNGPENSEISFVVEGLTTGTVTTAVLVDGRQAYYKTVPVGAPTPAQPGTGVSGTGPAATAPPPEEWRTYTSADGLAGITVAQPGSVGFLKVPAENVTPGMAAVSGPYALVPQHTTYLPPGKLQFQVPAGASPRGLAIAYFSGGAWTLLPSQAGNTTVSATVTSSGTYALFAPAATPSATATTTAVATTVTTMPAATTAATAPPPTTRAGIAAFTALIASGLGCALALAGRR